MVQTDVQDVRQVIRDVLRSYRGFDVLHSTLPKERGDRYVICRTMDGAPLNEGLDVYYAVAGALKARGYQVLDFQLGMRLMVVEIGAGDETAPAPMVRPMVDESALMNVLFGDVDV